VQLEIGSNSASLLYSGNTQPGTLAIDGVQVIVIMALQALINQPKIQSVALQNEANLIANSVARLEAPVNLLKTKSVSSADIKLQGVSPKKRVQPLLRDR